MVAGAHRLARDRWAVGSATILVLIVGAALAAPLWAEYVAETGLTPRIT